MTKKEADDVVHQAADLAEQVGEQAAERIAELKDQAVEAIEKRLDALAKLIQKHPLMAVGIGFGIGYVVARAMHRD